MSDLISRKATIEEIWNVFNNYANDGSKFDEYETKAINKAFTVLQKRIENLPIAYNVDKVVAELKEQCIQIDEHFMNYTEDAIDIVRKGGVE